MEPVCNSPEDLYKKIYVGVYGDADITRMLTDELRRKILDVLQ